VEALQHGPTPVNTGLGHTRGGQNAPDSGDRLLARGLQVILVGPPVGFTVPPNELLDKCPSATEDSLTLEELDRCAREHATVYVSANVAMKQYAERRGIPYVDLHELACNQSFCPILDSEGNLLFIDNWHRSAYGAAWLAQKVREHDVFDQVIGRE